MQKNTNILFTYTFAIVLVCIGHSFTAVESYYGHKWIYSFHMPLFMFLSGYLLKYTTAHRQCEIADIKLLKERYIYKRSIRLLLPYFVISSFSFIPKALLSAHALHPVDLSLGSYIHMLLYPQDNVIRFFWFLPTLFMINILSIILYKIRKKINVKIPIFIYAILLIILYEYNPIGHIEFLNLKDIPKYLIFFFAGCLFFNYEKTLTHALKLSRLCICILLFMGYSIMIYYIPWDTPFINIIYAFSGISFSYSLGLVYNKYNLKFLNHLYGSSYAIYLFSWYPLILIQSFLCERIKLPWLLWSAISVILQIYIPYILYKFIIYIKKHFRYGKAIALLVGQ